MNLLSNGIAFTASGVCAECGKKGRKCASFTIFTANLDTTHLVCQSCLEDIVDILSRISRRIVHLDDLE